MNNTRTLGIAAILIAATLVVGVTFAATTQSAFASSKGDGNENGNTITSLKCQNKGSASGFDTAVDQECENLICTHPSTACTEERGIASNSPPIPKTCQDCFTKFLTMDQINTIPDVSTAFINCTFLVNFTESEFRTVLINAGVDVTVANNLIACLRDVGIEFRV
jgi:hypothetical protein